MVLLVRRFLTGHTVRTTRQEGWTTLTDGGLLRVAEEAGFELLLTTGNSLVYRQNLKGRKIAMVVLSLNRWRTVERMMPRIAAAVDAATPGSYATIEIPVR